MDKRITIRESTAGDARYVGERLRESDRLEAEALGLRGVDAVMQSFYGSDECYTGLFDGEPMMLFGASGSLFRDEAAIWALGTEVCDRVPMAMVRGGRGIVRDFLTRYPVLTNWCDARYEKSLRWLKMIGFTIGAPEPYGVHGEKFCRLLAAKRQGSVAEAHAE